MFHRAVINTLENRVKEIENGFADTECAVMMNGPRSQAVHIWGVKACQRGRSMMTATSHQDLTASTHGLVAPI